MTLNHRGISSLLICWAVFAGCGGKEMPAPPPQAVPVIAAKVLVRNQPVISEYIGQTRGSSEVEIRARVEGFLEAIHFKEGGFVEEGQLLYTIDPKPYQAAVAEAEGLLAKAEAAWSNARQDLARLEPLVQKNAVSRQQYDEALANEKATRAAVQSARATVESAKLRLGYTHVTAPTSGLIGKSEVQPGNLVGQAQSTLLTSISTIHPIHVRFNMSETEYLELARRELGRAKDPQRGTNRFEMILADGALYPHKGSLVFADRNVDLTTGTLLMEVSFPNPERLIRPGQYARIRFPTSVLTNAVLVPQRAVQELQATYQAYIVGPGNIAEQRRVEPGPRIEDLWVISSGLNPGDTVIIEGLQRLRPGVPVNPTLVSLESESGAEQAGGRQEGPPRG